MTARGVRLNNPGNIEKRPGVRWQGQAETDHDGRFVTFKEPKWGIRAITRVLITYQDKRRAKDGSRIDTVQEIIERWAPPIENDTSAYVAAVNLRIDQSARGFIDVYDYKTVKSLVRAIITVENGVQPYSDDVIDAGLKLAGIDVPQKPLSQSRTLKAGAAAGLGTIAGAIVQQAEAVRAAIEPFVSIPMVQAGAFVLTLLSVGIIAWARIDDAIKEIR